MPGELKTTKLRDPAEDDLDEAVKLRTSHVGLSPLAPLGGTVAKRYQLQRPLGSGGHGDVWEALDTLSNERVAVKILMTGSERVNVRKEVSALRLLRVPGVVRLLDEGSDQGRQFLVMERVEGLPFPGAGAARRSWDAIATVSMALLETMARIHAAGVVHRDIKPTNVLVNDQGRPVVLDFGLAVGALGDRSIDHVMAGTPAYMAPEQMRGGETTARSDLFAVGVMLYEVVAGVLPYPGTNIYEVAFAKANRDALPLREVAPTVPGAVAAVIDRMVSRSPEHRPASAAEVLRVLRGEASDPSGHDELPRLGGREVVETLCASVAAGRSVDVVGPNGSGRTRTLRELAEALRAMGRKVVATVPGLRAFDSLVPALGDVPAEGVHRIDDAVEAMTERLKRELEAGDVLLVDDVERLDRTSATVIARSRSHGCVVRAVLPTAANRLETVEEVTLRPLTEVALRELFAGPERVFHLPSDAASALWARTEGWPARVTDEVTAWVRAGLMRRDGERFVIDREALDRLAAGHRIAPLLRGSTSSRMSMVPRAPLPSNLEDLLTWLTLAWPHTRMASLAAATQQPMWRLDDELSELEAVGAAHRLADERWEPGVAVAEGAWDAGRQRAAHRAIAAALPAGTEGRLVHLVAGVEAQGSDASAAGEIARESIALARMRAAEGRLGQGIAALSEGLLAARRAGHVGEGEAALLGVWVELALDEGTPRALDRVRYELSRARARTAPVLKLEALMEAAQAWRAGGERGLDMVEAIEPFEDRGLEMRRLDERIRATGTSPLERAERAVAEATRWAKALGDAALGGQAAEWEAKLRHRQYRNEEAAELLERAAEKESDLTRKLSFMRGLTIQMLEAYRYSEAIHWARATLALAQTVRSSHSECFAEYLLRASTYRNCQDCTPDMDLMEITERVGASHLFALIGMTEAAFAWRHGSVDTAVTLASAAHRVWTATGWSRGVAFSRAMILGITDGGEASERAELADFAMRCDLPGLGLQILALLAKWEPDRAGGWCMEGRRMAEALRSMSEGGRLEILSPTECLEALSVSRRLTDRQMYDSMVES